MKAKNCLIFGGTGQIGTNLIRKLAKKNYKVTVVTRNLHKKGSFIKTQANAGYIDIVELNPFNKELITPLFKKADLCINLVGILFEKGINNFNNIHVNFPSLLATLCKENSLEQFLHISAMGLDDAKDSKYAISKLLGEKKVKEIFPNTTILKPSVVYSVDDNFTTTFMTLISRLPFFPLYYDGNTKFMPIHCSDLTDVILKVINDGMKQKIIECGGPQVLTLKEMIKTLMYLINKNRLLLPTPLFTAKMMAKVMEVFPNPLITTDQLRLLKYDNIYSKKFDTDKTINVPSKKIFVEEVEKYCFMWKDGGQFSTKKYTNDLNS